jgi:protein-tyrosine phosphatase
MIQTCIALVGISNFRDFGGVPSSRGAVQAGRLYRSAHHGQATAGDLALLAELDIPLVVDLRKAGERNRYPSKRPIGFAGRVLERMDRMDGDQPPHFAFLAESGLTPERIRQYMLDAYAEFPYDESLLALYQQYIAALTAGPASVLVHCAAGKDRTGFVVALTQYLLGVSPETRMREYLLTNETMPAEDRLPGIAAAFLKTHGKPVDEALLRIVLHATPDFLETAFNTIRKQDGSVETYFERLGMDANMRARIEHHFLV